MHEIRSVQEKTATLCALCDTRIYETLLPVNGDFLLPLGYQVLLSLVEYKSEEPDSHPTMLSLGRLDSISVVEKSYFISVQGLD